VPIHRDLTRREALACFGAGALATGARAAAAAEQSLSFTALDHIETSAPDSARTAAFYARVFGGPVWKNKNTARRYIMLGSRYIAIEQGRQPFGVDHFSVGIEGLVVDDPDGIHIQLSADHTWADMKDRLASPEAGTEVATPIFQPAGLDHILLNVSDLPRSAGFYSKIFGAATQVNSRTWFQAGKSRIGLLQAPAGTKPGVNYYCVSATAFRFASVLKRLEEAGARVERPEVAGAPDFRDPDGLLVRVTPAE
jgi:catechol 2,3-dioxygenase-like lactoylglutathione lyase family enzyme